MHIMPRGDNMRSTELVASITAVAVALSNIYSEDELSLLAAILTQLGDTLTTISAQRELLEDNDNKENENSNQ